MTTGTRSDAFTLASDRTLVDDLRARLRGQLLLSGDAGYDDARSIWNAMIDRRPAIIVRALGVADVVACVAFARANGIELSIKGGGHNIAGLAVTDSGLMLDMSLMRGVFVDPATRIARAQAGCLLGDSNFIEGRFPGTRLIGIQVFEPSTVRMSFQLENVGAAGEETAINFFEDRCRSRTRVTISGRTFVGENDKVGLVKREAELSGVGDHLIEFSSDVRAQYILKVDVIPTRLKASEGRP